MSQEARSADSIGAELGFLWRLLAPYRGVLLLTVALLLGESLILLSMPWIAGQVAASLLEARVPTQLLLAWLGLISVHTLLTVGNGLLMGRTSAWVVADLGGRVFDHLQSLPVRWHQERKRGEVMALLFNDVQRVDSFLSGVLAPLLPLLLTCTGALAMLAWIEPRVGLAVAAGVPAFTILAKWLTRELRPLASAQAHADAVKYGLAEQNLATLSLVKAFTKEKAESDRFAIQSDEVRRLDSRQQAIQAMVAPALRWLGAAAVLALLWMGSLEVANGIISAPELIALLMYGMILTHPVSQLAAVWGQVQHARGSAQRLMAALSEVPEPDHGKRSLAKVQGDLAFEAVGFAYPGRSAILHGLDWQIRAGETVAVTGANGAGKSTLAHLLMRFADPGAGRITLDGVDLRDLSLRSLREQIGLVSQHVLLLNASVADNIGYGRFDASREQIMRAARAARADEFIDCLPESYDTLIGDEGLRLSGGQRQRISLARALLKDPAILVLDEATAMFDPEAERLFVDECHSLLHDRTVILITHRPASLALADRIFRLEGGQLQELPRMSAAPAKPWPAPSFQAAPGPVAGQPLDAGGAGPDTIPPSFPTPAPAGHPGSR